MPIKVRSFSVNLPFGLGGATVEVSEAEERAAWALYVQLSTRIATQPMAPSTGSVREALTSLYGLFDLTRSVLIEAGPDIGRSSSDLGPVAIRVLNEGLRPFLVHWHQAYGAHEAAETLRLMTENELRSVPDALIDQSSWAEIDTFYEELEKTRLALLDYVALLARFCDASHEKAAGG